MIITFNGGFGNSGLRSQLVRFGGIRISSWGLGQGIGFDSGIKIWPFCANFKT